MTAQERDQGEQLRKELAEAFAMNARMAETHHQALTEMRDRCEAAEASVQVRFAEIAQVTRRLLDAEQQVAKSRQELAEAKQHASSLRARMQEAVTRADGLQQQLAASGQQLAASEHLLGSSRLVRWALRGTRLVDGARRRLGGDGGSDAARHVSLIRSSELFDADWYARLNPDVAQAGVDLAEHYLGFGAAEGRDPGPKFSSRHYLEANPDVAAAGINPLLHYLMNGQTEGREAQPSRADA